MPARSRRRLATVVSAGLLTLAAPAVAGAASLPPFAGLHDVHVFYVKLSAGGRGATIRSCSVQRSRAGTTERKILPVACEQPPRSRLSFPLQHEAAAIASLLTG